MKLTLVWWNTSLAPLSKISASITQLNIVCNVLEWFVEQLQVDFIVLGEVNDEYFEHLEQNCRINGFRWFNLTRRDNRITFDTCVLVRDDKLQILDTENLIAHRASNSAKIGQKLIMAVADYDKPLHLFISHWASLLYCNGADRQYLGIRLRDEVDAIFRSDNSAAVILLGDYNDEPFADSLTTGLSSTRDITRVRKNPRLLYNPFWRHLGEAKIYMQGVDTTAKNRCGSYYYQSGSITRWHTFDQMLFSSCFIGGSAWHLNEELTGIIDTPELFNLVIDSKQKFDHLPIVSVLEKEVSHD
jgi:hypothetical protein